MSAYDRVRFERLNGYTPTDAGVRLCLRVNLPAYQCDAVLAFFNGDEQKAEAWILDAARPAAVSEDEQAYIKGQTWAWRRVLSDALRQLRALGVLKYSNDENVANAVVQAEQEHMEGLRQLRTRVQLILGEAWGKVEPEFDAACNGQPRDSQALLEQLQQLDRSVQLDILQHVFPKGWRAESMATIAAAGRLADAARELLAAIEHGGHDSIGEAAALVLLDAALKNWNAEKAGL